MTEEIEDERRHKREKALIRELQKKQDQLIHWAEMVEKYPENKHFATTMARCQKYIDSHQEIAALAARRVKIRFIRLDAANIDKLDQHLDAMGLEADDTRSQAYANKIFSTALFLKDAKDGKVDAAAIRALQKEEE